MKFYVSLSVSVIVCLLQLPTHASQTQEKKDTPSQTLATLPLTKNQKPEKLFEKEELIFVKLRDNNIYPQAIRFDSHSSRVKENTRNAYVSKLPSYDSTSHEITNTRYIIYFRHNKPKDNPHTVEILKKEAPQYTPAKKSIKVALHTLCQQLIQNESVKLSDFKMKYAFLVLPQTWNKLCHAKIENSDHWFGWKTGKQANLKEKTLQRKNKKKLTTQAQHIFMGMSQTSQQHLMPYISNNHSIVEKQEQYNPIFAQYTLDLEEKGE